VVRIVSIHVIVVLNCPYSMDFLLSDVKFNYRSDNCLFVIPLNMVCMIYIKTLQLLLIIIYSDENINKIQQIWIEYD